ncbi:MAG: L-seryl-tRNA(Sec) selenium transferase [candidate division WOR-3 bacterium]|nr:MAG: L-seryl-tRNA(Sec) selenium transferase [candidate division WOR-3 bacterium]
MKTKEILRNIPSVDKILSWDEIKEALKIIDQKHVTRIIRDNVENYRKILLSGGKTNQANLKKAILAEIQDLITPYFCYAVNALGIVLHTGLGRAPFNKRIAQVVSEMSLGYSRLQIDDEGKRADRYRKIDRLLQILTGCEAGIIVNNNAAATVLILNAIAKGKEVIVSRGQLIEIGGAYRIPDIMAQSGAIMHEIGTTNRTHLKDYAGAINENTGAILRVHQSNYRIIGFTKEVPLDDLVELGKKHDIPVIDDLGSGALIDFAPYGLPKEPMVQESISTGADVVCFSGDKLIGGPQCGIVIGKKHHIEKIKKNPLTRALRCDKITNAVLEATLQIFLLKEEDLISNHAVLGILLKPLDEIKSSANRCAKKLKTWFGTTLDVSVISGVSEIGGGSLSTEQLPTYLVAVKAKGLSANDLAHALRRYSPPVFSRVADDRVILDFRTVMKGEDKIILDAFKAILRTT